MHLLVNFFIKLICSFTYVFSTNWITGRWEKKLLLILIFLYFWSTNSPDWELYMGWDLLVIIRTFSRFRVLADFSSAWFCIFFAHSIIFFLHYCYENHGVVFLKALGLCWDLFCYVLKFWDLLYDSWWEREEIKR